MSTESKDLDDLTRDELDYLAAKGRGWEKRVGDTDKRPYWYTGDKVSDEVFWYCKQYRPTERRKQWAELVDTLHLSITWLDETTVQVSRWVDFEQYNGIAKSIGEAACKAVILSVYGRDIPMNLIEGM